MTLQASVLRLNQRDQVPSCHDFSYPSAENFRPRDLFLMGRNVGYPLILVKPNVWNHAEKRDN